MPAFSDIPYHIYNKYFLDLVIESEVKKRDKLFIDGELLWEDVLFDKGNAREIYFKDMPESIPRENVLNIINMNWNLHYHESISYAKNSYLIGPMTSMNAGRESSEFKEYWVKNHRGYEEIKLSLKDVQQDNNFVYEKKIDKLTDVYELDVEISSYINTPFFYPYTEKRYIKKTNSLKVRNKPFSVINLQHNDDNIHHISSNICVVNLNLQNDTTIYLPFNTNTKNIYVFVNNDNEYQLTFKYDDEEYIVNSLDLLYKTLHITNREWKFDVIDKSEIEDNLSQDDYIFKDISDIEIGDEIITSSGVERVFFKHFHDEVIINDVQYEPTNKVYFRKDSYFYFWLQKYYPQYMEQVAINKLFLYIGPIFNNMLYPSQSDIVDIIFYGMKDYVMDALPDINKTPRFSEFLKLYFDQVHQTLYKHEKEISALMDPTEIQSVHLPSLANTFDINVGKVKYNDFRLRQYINNYIYFLKRKGTYNAVIIIWLLLSTRNRLHIFDTFHNENIPLKNHYPYYTNQFIPFLYLNEKLHVTSDFQKDVITIDTLNNEEKPFVFEKDTPEHIWRINHTFNSNKLICYVYDKKYRQVIPARIDIIDNFNIVLYFHKAVNGWCFILKPFTITKNQLVQSTNNNYYYSYAIFYEYYAKNNDVIMVDSRNKEITIYLPNEPNHLDQVKVIDIYQSFDKHSVQLSGNGSKIKEYYDNMLLNMSGFNKTFLYIEDYGWTFIDSDLYNKTHIKTINDEYEAKRRDILLIDSRDNEVSITFPMYPYTYDQIKIIDIYDSFGINDVKINMNGQKIRGIEYEQIIFNSTGTDKTFVYINPDIGWLLINSSVLIDTNIKVIDNEYESDYNDILLVDSSEKEITIYLPPNPSQYDQVKIIDYYQTFKEHNVSINSLSKKIDVIYNNMILDVNGFDKTFIYVDNHVGWLCIDSSVMISDKDRFIDYTKMVRLYDDELIAMHRNDKNVIVHLQDEQHNIYKPVNIHLDNGIIKVYNNTNIQNHYLSYLFSTFRYVKEEPSHEWKIYHYLNTKGVICQCYDNDMNVIYPKEVILVSNNLCIIVFEDNVSGYVNIKPITNFEEKSNDIKLSTHYIVEMSLNEEPMDINEKKILSNNTIEGLYEAWENVRPAARASHYRVLISPTITMDVRNEKHYSKIFTPNFHTSCKIENINEYYTHTHKQYYYNEVWNIEHGLFTNNILSAFYDEDGNQVKPRLVECVDKDNINVYFYERVKGYGLFAQSMVHDRKDVRSNEWVVRSPYRRKVLMNITDIYNNNRFIPKSVKFEKNEFINIRLTTNDVGYVNLTQCDYTHNQIIPKKTWRVNHNLLRGVMCQCYSWYNELIIPDNVKLIDDVTCEITFSEPWCGYANIKSINSLIFEDDLIGFLETSTFRVGIRGSEKYDKSLQINGMNNDIEHEIYRGNVIVHKIQNATYIQVDVPINAMRNDKDFIDFEFPMTELGIFNRHGKMLFYSHFNEIFKPKDVSMRFLYKVEYN